MIVKSFLLIFSLSILVSCEKDQNLCKVCKCVNDSPALSKTQVKCTNYNFTSYPKEDFWPPNVHTLLLNKNYIKRIDYLSHNGMLKVLDLSYNNIDYIAPRGLSNYIGLEVLDLSFNYLERLDQMTFYGLEYLKVLNLTANGFNVIPDLFFNTLIGLKEIRLASNPLQSLDSREIKPMMSLENIDLSDIGSHYLPGDLFKQNILLKKIDLSNNKFDEVPIAALRSARGLQELILNDNYFSELDDKSFYNLHSLKLLQLNRNYHLNVIEERTFSSLRKLKVLEITNCPRLTHIHERAFETLFKNLEFISLTEVYLNDNGLRTLDANMLPWDSIETLNIQNNNWLCDCKMKWILNRTFEDWYRINLFCADPPELIGKEMMKVPKELFVCPKVIPPVDNSDHEERILRSMTLLMAALILFTFGLLLVLYFKRNQIKTWWAYNKRKNGAIYYVRAHSNPVDQNEDYGPPLK